MTLPTLFVKHDCPFSLKVRLFVLEAGLLDQVEIAEGSTEAELAAMREALAPHVSKSSFPTARFGADDYVSDSDEILARLDAMYGVSPDSLPTYRAYVDGPMARLMTLHREVADLKRSASAVPR